MSRPRVWLTPAVRARLGTVPDEELAVAAGVAATTVCWERRRRSIPACRQHRRGMRARAAIVRALAEAQDPLTLRELAELVGLCRSTVQEHLLLLVSRGKAQVVEQKPWRYRCL